MNKYTIAIFFGLRSVFAYPLGMLAICGTILIVFAFNFGLSGDVDQFSAVMLSLVGVALIGTYLDFILRIIGTTLYELDFPVSALKELRESGCRLNPQSSTYGEYLACVLDKDIKTVWRPN